VRGRLTRGQAKNTSILGNWAPKIVGDKGIMDDEEYNHVKSCEIFFLFRYKRNNCFFHGRDDGLKNFYDKVDRKHEKR
jgi:hypothetical protein